MPVGFVFDPAWWLLPLLVAISSGWWGGAALLGAVLPRGRRPWRRVVGFVAGALVAGATYAAAFAGIDAAGAGVAGYRWLDRSMVVGNGVAAVTAVTIGLRRRAGRGRAGGAGAGRQ